MVKRRLTVSVRLVFLLLFETNTVGFRTVLDDLPPFLSCPELDILPIYIYFFPLIYYSHFACSIESFLLPHPPPRPSNSCNYRVSKYSTNCMSVTGFQEYLPSLMHQLLTSFVPIQKKKSRFFIYSGLVHLALKLVHRHSL